MGSSRASFRARTPVEHKYSLNDKSNAPWLSLRVMSNARSAQYPPSYFEGQTVAGTVDLNLARPESIRSVSINITGQIIAVNLAPFTFWETSKTLWSTDMGDPHLPPAVVAQSKYSGKLQGRYSWDFSLTLPSTCTVRVKKGTKTLRLPPSFSEKGASQFISYEIYVRIRRGPLRIDSRLGTPFAYSPRIRPGSASVQRQLSYQRGEPLHGPEQDPSGWTTLEPVKITGTLFGVRPIEAMCTLSLASPLIYTRGLSIPCSLTVACPDRQCVDLLTALTSPDVKLMRQVTYGPQPNAEGGSPSSTLQHSTTEVSAAVWSRSADHPNTIDFSNNMSQRTIDGEVHLPQDLQPNFEFGDFSLKYHIVMSPFTAAAYQPSDKSILLKQAIDIATLPPYGPMPRTYTPPSYANNSSRSLQFGSLVT